MQNMNMALALLGVVLFFLVGIFVYRKKQGHRQISNIAEVQSAVVGVTKKDNKQKLTMQEMIELSWKFLYDITELIVSKFSKGDKELLNKLGHVLLDNGMRYEHVVDLAVQSRTLRSQNVEQQSQGQSQKTIGI
jgi:hypothetical protein